jgi:hypothetical protein
MLRASYEIGSRDGAPARYNQLAAHIDRVGSYVFAPDSIRFGVRVPRGLPDRPRLLSMATVARDEFAHVWNDAGADLDAVVLIEWALAYGATIAKVDAAHGAGFRVGYIAPGDFGVSREDVPPLDDQDTMCHWYSLSMPQLKRWLGGERDADRLLDRAKAHATTGRLMARGVRGGLIVTGITGTFPNSSVQGGFAGGSGTEWADEAPTAAEEPVVSFVDLWERKLFRRQRLHGLPDVFEDWRVTTLFEDDPAGPPFLERRNPVLPWTRTSHDIALPGEHPFVIVRPRPLPDSVWGRSELRDVIRLQEWLHDHLGDMRDIIKRELDPSKFFSGLSDWEEAGQALSTVGGGYGAADPTAKVTEIKPNVGQEAFEMVKLIREFFADASGLPTSLTEPGSVSGGVRSQGHFSMAAGIGAGRIRRMALVIEDALGQIATKGFHIVQRHDDRAYPLRPSGSFLLSAVPADVRFRVDAHSAAPIFAEQDQAKAMLMKRVNAIGAEDFVDLLRPSNADELKERARVREEAQAQQTQKLLEAQEASLLRGGSRGRPRLPK